MSSRLQKIRSKLAEDIKSFQPKQIVYGQAEYLNKYEIDDILNVLPSISSPDKEAAKHSLDQIKKYIRIMLTFFKVVKSCIPEFKRRLRSLFIRSKIAPGAMVGLLAVQALIAQLMQGTLNTFHTAGSSKNAESGIKAYRDIMHVVKEIRDPTTYLYFKDNVSYEDIIYKLRPLLLEATISTVTKDTEVLDKTEIYDNGFTNKYYFLYTYTHNLKQDILSIIANNEQTGESFLRITMDVNKLYAHKLTTDDVCKSFTEYGENKIICVPSPIFMKTKKIKKLYTVNNYTEYYDVIEEYPTAYIDIFIITNKITSDIDDIFGDVSPDSKNNRYINETYIDNILIPSLDNILIKGIKGITNIYPETASVWSAIEEEINNGDTWIVRFKDIVFEKTGITKDNIRHLLDTINVKILSEGKYHMEVSMPEIPEDAKKILNTKHEIIWKPSRLINYYKLKELDNNNQYADMIRKKKKELIDQGKFIEADNLSTSKPATKFENALEFVYGITDGNNMPDLIVNELLDYTKILSNDVREILYNFGIEAARSYLIEHIYNIIKLNDNYIDSRHIILIAEVMTMMGFIVPLNPTGASLLSDSTLWLAGQSFPSKHFRSGAIMGNEENVRGIYSAMIAGAPAPFGSTMTSVSLNKQLEKEFTESSNILAELGTDASTLSRDIELALNQNTNNIMVGEEYVDDTVYQITDTTSGISIGTTKELHKAIPTPIIQPSSVLASPSIVSYIPKVTSDIITEISGAPSIVKDTIQDVTISSHATEDTVSLPGPEGINKVNIQQPVEKSMTVSFPVHSMQTPLPDVLGRISNIIDSKE